MRVPSSVVMRSFADLGVVFEEADPDDRDLIRTARMTGDLGPLLDHLAATDPEMTRTRSLLIHSALTLAVVDAGLDPDDLVKDARSALALFDKAASQPDFHEHLTPPLRRQFRARIQRMIKKAERFESDWSG